jgi:hypothetical protein
LAVLLAGANAFAAGPAEGSGAGSKGDTGGKGGLGPENSIQSGAQGAQEESTTPDLTQQYLARKSAPDQVTAQKVEEKPWEVSATWETHRLLEQQYVANSTSKTFNILYASINYALTDNDTVYLSDGIQQLFEADPGEPGVRLSDISLGYTHVFPLPAKFRLATSASINAPIGYYSQLASNITSPGVSIRLSRRFGDLSLAAGIRGSYSWDRYTTQNNLGCGTQCPQGAEGVNNQWSAGGFLSAEYQMPFHRPLSVGAQVSDGYYGFYNVGSSPYTGNTGVNDYGYGANTYPGATTNPNTDNNPWQQSYGWEVFARYSLPDLSGFKSDILISLADGGPGVGDPNVLHDGIVHPYFLYYETAQAYFAYSGRY